MTDHTVRCPKCGRLQPRSTTEADHYWCAECRYQFEEDEA
jgi:DNA-directed RNA polymerase subunit RPC12/RpoP